MMVYFWSRDMPQIDIQHEVGVSKVTSVDWCNFMRKEYQKWLNSNTAQIGGIDHNFDPIIAEIAEAEAKYFHRKYQRPMAERPLGIWRY
jgi:hypothetical protein